MEKKFYLVQGVNGKKLKYTTEKDAETVGNIIAVFSHEIFVVNYFCTYLSYYTEWQAKNMVDGAKRNAGLGNQDWLNI